MLLPEYVPRFLRDVKKLEKKKVDISQLVEVANLICQDDEQSIQILKQRHKMHNLDGNWDGARECHVANAGDWLVIWRVKGNVAYFLRTGTHDELFR